MQQHVLREVRETFSLRSDLETEASDERKRQHVLYRADGGELDDEWHHYDGWRPSIHMPRWASRLTLEITAVRVERLQDISEADAVAEGVQLPTDERGRPLLRISGKFPPCAYAERRRQGKSFDDAILRHWTHRTHYASLWDSINFKRVPWASNPWVWVIEFRRITT